MIWLLQQRVLWDIPVPNHNHSRRPTTRATSATPKLQKEQMNHFSQEFFNLFNLLDKEVC